jgi:hypothetical protein
MDGTGIDGKSVSVATDQGYIGVLLRRSVTSDGKGKSAAWSGDGKIGSTCDLQDQKETNTSAASVKESQHGADVHEWYR